VAVIDAMARGRRIACLAAGRTPMTPSVPLFGMFPAGRADGGERFERVGFVGVDHVATAVALKGILAVNAGQHDIVCSVPAYNSDHADSADNADSICLFAVNDAPTHAFVKKKVRAGKMRW
jgi:hypothetical protein